MHAMQAPEQRDGMKNHVLQIDREVKDDDRGQDGNPARERNHIEQPNAIGLGQKRNADSSGWKNDANQQGVERYNAEVVWPAPTAPEGHLSTWLEEFPHRDETEYAAKGGQTDIGFDRKNDFTRQVIVRFCLGEGCVRRRPGD